MKPLSLHYADSSSHQPGRQRLLKWLAYFTLIVVLLSWVAYINRAWLYYYGIRYRLINITQSRANLIADEVDASRLAVLVDSDLKSFDLVYSRRFRGSLLNGKRPAAKDDFFNLCNYLAINGTRNPPGPYVDYIVFFGQDVFASCPRSEIDAKVVTALRGMFNKCHSDHDRRAVLKGLYRYFGLLRPDGSPIPGSDYSLDQFVGEVRQRAEFERILAEFHNSETGEKQKPASKAP